MIFLKRIAPFFICTKKNKYPGQADHAQGFNNNILAGERIRENESSRLPQEIIKKGRKW